MTRRSSTRATSARSQSAGGWPCGSGRSYSTCCAPLHRGAAPAETAEALMRSRYTAFVRGLRGYLLDTWHPEHRPEALELDPALEWCGLTVLAMEGGGAGDVNGTVEFDAVCRVAGREEHVHEESEFERLDGRWVYTKGAS